MPDIVPAKMPAFWLDKRTAFVDSSDGSSHSDAIKGLSETKSRFTEIDLVDPVMVSEMLYVTTG
ncbi:MAG TPA: hypothetical protein VHL11_22390 [Phototrophicaceae bacterium]|nr:hypothetical protein [Phototrophicaceae bacterium]